MVRERAVKQPAFILAAVIWVATIVLGGCLSDETLRLECDFDDDCPSGRCERRVCIPPGADVGVPSCGAGLTACGSDCVDLRRSAEHCGECFEPCLAGSQESAACLAATCVRECAGGWIDLDGPEVPGCDYECTPSVGVTDEVCDGIDNDCDGLTDDEDPSATSPACADQDGVCRGARQPCVGGTPRGCSDVDYATHAGDLLELGEELICDGLDNNCDGRVDEHCCDGADDRFEGFIDGRTWTVGGFQWRGEDLVLIAHNGEEVVPIEVDRYRGLDSGPGWPLLGCHFDELHYSADRAAMYGLCNGIAFGLRAEDGRDAELGRVPDGTRSYRLQADGEEGVELVAVSFVAEEANTTTVLARDDGGEPLVAPFEPPTPHAGTSVAWTNGTGVASFVVPGEEVRLQLLDEFLRPVGFGVRVASIENADGVLHETDLVGAGRGRVLVFYPSPDGGLATATWTLGDEEAVLGPVLGSDPILRIDASRSRVGVLATAVTETALESWLLSESGEEHGHWRLPMEDVTRNSSLGQTAMRVATATDGEQLWIAFGSPGDALGPDDGLLVIRLGRNSIPLCQ